MIAEIKVHTDEQVLKVADVSEDYRCVDFIVDVLKLIHRDSPAHHWALRHGLTGKILQRNLTLGENQVAAHHDLYLVEVRPRELKLEVNSPSTETLQIEIHSTTDTGPFLANLVTHFRLPASDSSGKPSQWILVRTSIGERLDPDLSLADNGVLTKDRLSIQMPQEVLIGIEVTAPGGKSWRMDLSEEAVKEKHTSEFLRELIEHFDLPSASAKGAPLRWRLVFQSSGAILDVKKTLAENGLSNGGELLLEQVSEPPIQLHVCLLQGPFIPVDAPGEMLGREFLDLVMRQFDPDRFNWRGKPMAWLLADDRTESPLDLNKTMAENGVKNGDRLRLLRDGRDLKLQVTAPSGANVLTEEPGETPSSELLRDLIAHFQLETVDGQGKAIQWFLTRPGSGAELVLAKSLRENGLVSGDRLQLRQPQIKPLPGPKPKWLGIAAIALVLFVIIGAAIAFTLFRPINVQIAPNSATVSEGGLATFHPTVTGHGQHAVQWTVSASGPGSSEVGRVDAEGNYTAPTTILAPQQVLVKATSADDASKSDSATVTLQPAPIRISPASANVDPKGTSQFHSVLRTDAGSATQWKLEPNVGSISPDGIYTAPGFVPSPMTVTLIASSQSSPQYTAKASIVLSASPPIHVVPATIKLIGSGKAQFSLDADPGMPVQWRIQSGEGSISSSGLYKAPAFISVQKRVQVMATVASGPTPAQVPAGANGEPSPSRPGPAPASTNAPVDTAPLTATIILEPLTMGAVTCTPGQKQYACKAQVNNAADTAVTWSINPALGAISSQGVYTPPKHNAPQFVDVTAKSQADSSKSSTLRLTLAPQQEVIVKIDQHGIKLRAGVNEKFTATVTGASNKNVGWSSSGPGIILGTGVYEPPATVSPGAKVSITATSVADNQETSTETFEILPAPHVNVPQAGNVTWVGTLEKHHELTIVNNVPDTGHLVGVFPGAKIRVTCNSADCEIKKTPSAENGWKGLTVKAKHNLQAILFQWTLEP